MAAYKFWPRQTADSSPAKITKISEWNRSIISPILSPDGRTIAFASPVNGYDQMFVMLTSGGQPLQLTKDEGNKTPLAFSADGNEILFGPSIGDYEIWAIPTLGGSPHRVANGIAVAPCSDGHSLFVGTLGGQIYRTDISGGSPEVLIGSSSSVAKVGSANLGATSAESFYGLLAFPDCKSLLTLGRVGSTSLIEKLDVDTKKSEKIAEFPENLGHPSWAEPGKAIYITRLVKGITNLWQYSLADGSLKQITFGAGPDRNPLGDPAGKGVYFVNGRSSGVLTAYHTATKQTLDVVNELATQPLVSSTGKQLAYLRSPEPGTRGTLDCRHRRQQPQEDSDLQPVSGDAHLVGRRFSVRLLGSRWRQEPRFRREYRRLSTAELPSPAGRADFGAVIPGTTAIMFTNYNGRDPRDSTTWRLDLKDPAAKPETLFQGCTGALVVSHDGNFVLGPVLWGANPGLYQYSLRDKKCTALKPGLASYFVGYARDDKSFLFAATVHGQTSIYRQALHDGEATGEPQNVLTYPFALREDFAGNAFSIADDLSVMVYARPSGQEDFYFLSAH